MKMISFSSTPASSESSSTRESAVVISGGDSQGILEEPLPSTSSEEEDPLAGEPHVSSGYPGLVSASCSHWHGNAHNQMVLFRWLAGVCIGGEPAVRVC